MICLGGPHNLIVATKIMYQLWEFKSQANSHRLSELSMLLSMLSHHKVVRVQSLGAE